MVCGLGLRLAKAERACLRPLDPGSALRLSGTGERRPGPGGGLAKKVPTLFLTGGCLTV